MSFHRIEYKIMHDKHVGSNTVVTGCTARGNLAYVKGAMRIVVGDCGQPWRIPQRPVKVEK